MTAGIPSAPTPPCPLPPAELRGSLDELFRLTEAEGRDPKSLTISFKAPVYDVGHRQLAGGERRPFRGARRSRSRTTSRLRDAWA